MEKRFQVLTMDADGTQHIVAGDTDVDNMRKLINILVAGEDPNNFVDIVIRPFIKL